MISHLIIITVTYVTTPCDHANAHNLVLPILFIRLKQSEVLNRHSRN